MRAEDAAKLTKEALAHQIATVLAYIRHRANEGKYHAIYTDEEYTDKATSIAEALHRLGYQAHAISSNSVNISW